VKKSREWVGKGGLTFKKNGSGEKSTGSRGFYIPEQNLASDKMQSIQCQCKSGGFMHSKITLTDIKHSLADGDVL
jgi:hypothetical protein